MTEPEHVGRWVDVESSSGQDDTAYIACSCGWRSRAIWSRTAIPHIQHDFERHQDRGPVCP